MLTAGNFIASKHTTIEERRSVTNRVHSATYTPVRALAERQSYRRYTCVDVKLALSIFAM